MTTPVPVRVLVPASLRELVGGAARVVVGAHPGDGTGLLDDTAAVTVGAVLDALAVDHPALERRLRDETGRPRVHVNLFVGADNVRDLSGLATPVPRGVDVAIIPAVSGG
jgi:sulfur-carrier protein